MEAFFTQYNRTFFDNPGFWSFKTIECCLESFDICDYNGYVSIDYIEKTLTNKFSDPASFST